MTGYIYRGDGQRDDPDPSTCRGATGKVKGYGRHTRAGERPCDRCREAMNAYNRKRRKKWASKPGATEADSLRRKARARAWAELARRHKDEYQALLRSEIGRLHAESSGGER